MDNIRLIIPQVRIFTLNEVDSTTRRRKKKTVRLDFSKTLSSFNSLLYNSEEELKDIVTTQTGGARMGASEQAQADATKLSSETLSMFPQDDNVDLTHAATDDFLRAALNDIATPDERNALTQSDGKINQDGINRVKRALFALAYGDNGLISRMSESTDDNVRGATNALLNAAPTIAKVQAAMENGMLHKYDLSAIADAVKKLSALRDEGKPVQKYLQEQSLFAEHADSAESKEILSFLDKSKRAPNKISTFLKKIASNIQSQGDPRQGNLFGFSDEPKSLMDTIR